MPIAQQAFALVIPDCCNLDVVFRILITVNLAVMVAILLCTDSLIAEAGNFVESLMLIAPACFLSLSILYGLHRIVHLMAPVLVEARLQALQARICPHILFNSLNVVLSLIRTEPRRRWKIWPL